MYAQIGSIDTGHLPADQAAFIDSADTSIYDHFVEITDGDSSEPRAIDTSTVYSPADLAAGIGAGSVYGYIAVHNDYTEAVALVEARACAEEKAFWSGERLFYVGA